MILIKYLLLVLVGLAGAGFVAGGTFAFITMLGIVPRLAGRTGTGKYILWYENLIIVGGGLGNFFSIRAILFSGNNAMFGSEIALAVFGVFSGMFVGCLAMALAEVLQVIPVFAKRIRLRTGKPTGKPKGMSPGIPVIVLSIALGKMAGSLFQMFLGW